MAASIRISSLTEEIELLQHMEKTISDDLNDMTLTDETRGIREDTLNRVVIAKGRLQNQLDVLRRWMRDPEKARVFHWNR